MKNEYFSEALNMTVQRLIKHYLAPTESMSWVVEGAWVAGRRVGNRYGIPADAITCRYLFEHPEQGWAFAVRGAWHDGDLLRPLATHVVVEGTWDDTVGPEGSLLADWIASLSI